MKCKPLSPHDIQGHTTELAFRDYYTWNKSPGYFETYPFVGFFSTLNFFFSRQGLWYIISNTDVMEKVNFLLAAVSQHRGTSVAEAHLIAC